MSFTSFSILRVGLAVAILICGIARLSAATLSFLDGDNAYPLDGMPGDLPYHNSAREGKRVFPCGPYTWKLDAQESEWQGRGISLQTYTLARNRAGELWLLGNLNLGGEPYPWLYESDKGLVFVIGWMQSGNWQVGTVLSPNAYQRNFPSGSMVSFKVSEGAVPRGPLSVFAYQEGRLLPLDVRNVRERSRDGNGAQHFAALQGDLSAVKEAFVADASLFLKRNRFGESPLMLAARNGRDQIVSFLLESDPDLQVTNKYGDSILQIAIKAGHPTVVSKILEHSKPKKGEWFGLLKSASWKNEATLLALLNSPHSIKLNGKQQAELNVDMAESGHVAAMLRFEDRFPGASNKRFRGMGRAHVLALANDERASELFDRELDWGAVDKDGETALDLAFRKSNAYVLAAMAEAQPDVFSNEALGNAWDVALRGGSVELVKSLASLKEVNAIRIEGASPFMKAILSGNLELAESILELGAEWDFASADLGHALAICIRDDNVTLLQAAIGQGLDLDTALVEEVSPLLLARYYGAEDVASILETEVSSGRESEAFPALQQVIERSFATKGLFSNQIAENTFQVSAILCKDGLLRYPKLSDTVLPERLRNHVLAKTELMNFKKLVQKGIPGPIEVSFLLSFDPAKEDPEVYAIDYVDDEPIILSIVRAPGPNPSSVRPGSLQIRTISRGPGQPPLVVRTGVPPSLPAQNINSVVFRYRVGADGKARRVRSVSGGRDRAVGDLHLQLKNAAFLPARVLGIPVTVEVDTSLVY